MTKYYDTNPPYIQADADKVLCDGYSKTSLGGKVYGKEESLEEWQEMTEAAAEALIAANTGSDEPMTEIEEKAAAYDIIMGVTDNE